MQPLEIQRLGRLSQAWRGVIRRNGGIENTLAVLRAAEPQQKTPPDEGGVPGRTAIRPAEKDTNIMSAVPLFANQKEASPSRKSLGVTEAQQLESWLRQGRNGVFTVTTMLTPALASLLLASNENNRPVKATAAGTRSVAAYAAMMLRGEWKLNGSTLVVADDGQLNDGQHRCHACIEAGVAVPVQIAFGVERETRTTLDQGIARSPGNILAMVGQTDSNVLATYLQFRTVAADGGWFSRRLTPDELLVALERFPNFHDHLPPIRNYAARKRLSTGYMAGAHGLCVEGNPIAAAAWAEAVSTGVGITSVTSPVARLRRIFEDRAGMRRDEAAALYIKGFNNFCRGRTGPITWRDKDKSEPFPTVVKP